MLFCNAQQESVSTELSNPPSTLADLVAPLGEAAFLELLHARKLRHVRGAGAGSYGKLLNWEQLAGMIGRGEHPRRLTEFKLIRESVMVPPERWLKAGGPGEGNKVDFAKLTAFMAQGFSLTVTQIEPHVPALAALCDDIRMRTHEKIKAGVIVTTGRAGAFTLHYDPEDLIILQVEGRKRWKIFGPAVARPVIGMAKPAPPPEDTPLFDDDLEPGDFLFVPAGHWHRCENGPERSLHLGIFFEPPTAWHAIRSFTQGLVDQEVFRTPLTRTGDAAKLEADCKALAIEAIERMDLGAFFAQWSRSREN
jgi:hypothetical protein